MIARTHYAPAPQTHRKDGIAPHGTRTRYIHHKCRCDECRSAIREYERNRRRRRGYFDAPPIDWEHYLVDASPARQHLLWLSSQGIGVKFVQRVTGLGGETLTDIKYGKRRWIYGATRDKILGLTLRAIYSKSDGHRVPAAETWRLLEEIRACGFAAAWIALEIGSKTPAIQLHRDFVNTRNARAVKQLHDRLWKENAEGGQVRSRWGWRGSGIRMRDVCKCEIAEDPRRAKDRLAKRRERAGKEQ